MPEEPATSESALDQPLARPRVTGEHAPDQRAIYTLDARERRRRLARRARRPHRLRRIAEDINARAGERVVDLGGRAVLPGLVDAHAHLMLLARSRPRSICRRRPVGGEIARLVGAAAAAPPRASGSPGAAGIRPAGRKARFPARASLDRAAPRHPVALTRVDGHATWANSAALAAAGIIAHARRSRRGSHRGGGERRAHGPAHRHGPGSRRAWAAGAVAGSLRAGRTRGDRALSSPRG